MEKLGELLGAVIFEIHSTEKTVYIRTRKCALGESLGNILDIHVHRYTEQNFMVRALSLVNFSPQLGV